MTDTKRALGVRLAVFVVVGGGGVALLAGYGIANSGNDDGILGIQEAVVGGAVATGILAVICAAAVRVARRYELSLRRDLAPVLAWVLFVPAGIWTFFWLVVLSMGGHDAMSIEEVAPDWAVFAVPLFTASGFLFLIARRR